MVPGVVLIAAEDLSVLGARDDPRSPAYFPSPNSSRSFLLSIAFQSAPGTFFKVFQTLERSVLLAVLDNRGRGGLR